MGDQVIIVVLDLHPGFYYFFIGHQGLRVN